MTEPDYEELPDEDGPARSDYVDEGFRSRAQLVARASAAGMTPMEYLASGKATARVRYEADEQRAKSHGLPRAPLSPTAEWAQRRVEIKALEGSDDGFRPSATQERINKWLDETGGKYFVEGLTGATLDALQNDVQGFNGGSPSFWSQEILEAAQADRIAAFREEAAEERGELPVIVEDEIAEGEIVE